jgi:hypothetical protein
MHDDDAWIRKVTLDENFTMTHASQFVDLWVTLREVQLHENIDDDIVWKLSVNCQ